MHTKLSDEGSRWLVNDLEREVRKWLRVVLVFVMVVAATGDLNIFAEPSHDLHLHHLPKVMNIKQ